jgi:flagellin-like protein
MTGDRQKYILEHINKNMLLGDEFSSGSADRGQSEVIGVVLLLSITVVVVTAISASGAGVLGDAQTDSRIAQTENSMSQMSSKAGLVALGNSDTHTFDLGDIDDGTVEVREDAGEVRLYLDENTDPIYKETYGAVVATVGGAEVAYQGGGVWKKDGDRSIMVSPPEYHYQQQTLTFPVIRVAGEDRTSGSVQGQLINRGDSQSIYPDGSEKNTNPLEDGKVIVEIQSEYYQGWYEFFDARTEGTVEIDDETQTVTVELDVPFETTIENAVTTTLPDGITINGGEKPDPHQEGVDYPSASPVIDNRIDRCVSGEDDCSSIDGNETIQHTEAEDGIYYASDEEIPDTLTVNTNGQDIDVVINGDFNPDDLSINEGGSVSFYVKGEFNLHGSDTVNKEGDPSQLFVYLHSDVNSGHQGTPSFTGVIYAPNTDFTLGGNTDFEGALIVNSLRIDGNAGTFTYDESLEVDIEITESADTITYLHVTENEVKVELR